jgi:ankyrin repeat protein
MVSLSDPVFSLGENKKGTFFGVIMTLFSKLKFGFASLFISLLCIACSGDPDAELKLALTRGIDIYYGRSNESDIQPALEQIRQAVIDGADPNLVYGEATPLLLAVWKNDTGLAALLIDHGADVSAQDLDRDGEVDTSPVVGAITGSEEIDPDMISLLVEAGADVDSNGELAAAVGADSIDTVKALLRAGADPNVYAAWDPPLVIAAGEGNVEMFDLLRASGAEVGDAGMLLVIAASSINPEMVKRVLPLYAGPKEGVRPFELVSPGLLYENEKRKKDAITVLEQLRTAGYVPVPDEFTFEMIEAAGLWDAETLKILLSYGASTNTVDESGETCLMFAIKKASMDEAIENMIDTKRLFELQDTHVKDTVRLLLEHDADVNAQDDKGRTALMHAATSFNVTAVQLLLERGADQNLTDENGQTAAQQMLASQFLQDQNTEAESEATRAVFGLSPEFLAQIRGRAEQIRMELKLGRSVISASPHRDAKPM